MKPQHGHLQTVSLEVPKFWSPPRSPSYSLGPLWPPCFTVSLLGKHRVSPKWYPDPALAQSDGDKTTKVVAAISLLPLVVKPWSLKPLQPIPGRDEQPIRAESDNNASMAIFFKKPLFPPLTVAVYP